ncbi:hypothetical protein PT974_11806 [Cladobotryum mycophilum]|uniref:DUF7905 domain-containing protein n=1 Tax=Cladobotryum mycophilum TaxID=491253 RepID=A0ABR0S684_9HYPO
MKRNRRQDSSRDAGPKNSPAARKNSSQFARADHMATAKWQDKDLIEVRLVIPGEHMLPRGLDNRTTLDSIRISHKVWITNVEPNIFKICGESMLQLRQAVRAINDVIHDMRLANEYLNTRFMVQKPSRDSYSVPIIFELSSRPHMKFATPGARDMMSTAIDAHTLNIQNELLANLDVLTSCGTYLKMRVNFGHLNIRQKRKGQEDELNFDELAKVMKMYSTRGGARLDRWLAGPRLAEKVFQRLKSLNLCFNKREVRQSYSVTVTIDDQKLQLGTFVLPGSDAQLSVSKLIKPEAFSRLNCTIAAPDMKFDWNLQVDSCENSDEIPSDVRELVEGMSLKIPVKEDREGQELVIPRLAVFKPGNWDSKVSETQLKTSATIPFKNTPYVVDISITQKWKGLRPPMEPETGWGIEIYGVHWDEAVNHVIPGERKKNWGRDMEHIWEGKGKEGVKTAFKGFIKTILEVQSVLDDMDLTEGRIGGIGG